MPQSSVVQGIERTLTSEAKAIGIHFQKIDQLSLAVSMLLEQELGKGANTYRQWESIATTIRDVVSSVRQVSIDGQARVEDVLTSFHDYMCFSRETQRAKAEEIKDCKAGLQTLAVRTKEVVSNVFTVLEETHAKIAEFDHHWPVGESQYSKNIKPRIQEVQNNVKAIQKSIEDLRACESR
ncbi:hypothetical protein SCHPADRAFT_363169 [Schizopora paradoxa]|uniref:Fungal N-terminal domain-containing protein n=1 Tax=Schizopora paradoxa TaxID=27342 RepID=A0A0H2RVN2_9AGAM|nr:hypothetical protein SCHPADRAFT_363169 [Schizopora paradoxa]